MKTKITTVSKAILALVLLIVCTAVNAQIKYDSNGWLTIATLLVLVLITQQSFLMAYT